ncbi:MAG: hypothetical protein KC503_00310 [Myxococcales bacterium]|nr:hypothetical protein [Myxococcales bacterium]
MASKDTRHARQIFIAVGVVIIAVAVLQSFAIPDTYGKYGHFRGAAVAEAKKRAPRHVGSAACAKCHAKQARLRAKDAHAHVQCETCHGPGYKHWRGKKKIADMPTPKGKRLCLTCHQVLAARPSSFPQIEVAAHYKLVSVKDTSINCTTCHDPHEPLFMDRDLRSARLHPVVHRCRDCHAGSKRSAETTKKPEGHPAIFSCDYCHKSIVKDFANRTHKKVRCTTCHIFFRDSAFAGRIIRDTDPRFCLLCHQKGKFRRAKGPPQIVWPKHRADNGDEEDKNKVCIDCHRDNIHGKGHARAAVGDVTPASLPAAAASQPAKSDKKPDKKGDKKPAKKADKKGAK